ncbi:MAG: FtsW/RodA/SpoVE family cell cycle protein [Eubacterium sp.]|nr:FtsW/RodA/SpoVE family cell cycle protein [Eubacterium sp.]
METFINVISKYLFIVLMFFYTWESFSALRHKRPEDKAGIFQRQNAAIFLTYLLGIFLVYMNQTDTSELNVIILGGVQLCYLIIVLGVFPIIYPNINKAILSNMCMLLTIGFIVLARLGMERSIMQFMIVSVMTIFSLMVPFFMSRFEWWKNLTWVYCFVGIGLLVAVIILGSMINGARLYIIISGVRIQPSEFVKIIFVFFVAAVLGETANLKQVFVSAIFAGIYVIILVFSTDLGSALIFFTMYLFMVYVASRKSIYLFLGGGGMAVASYVAYHLFPHIQVRVQAWQNPLAEETVNGSSHQVAQSLFALGSGGLSGTGLYQGFPKKVPLVENDFIFSAIGEEFGAIFAGLLILVCLSCFIEFLATGMEQESTFNRLVCVGLGVGYAIQVILTVGGAINMIPSTGVTLPLISSGRSSIVSILLVFSIIQGLAIVGSKKKTPKQRKKPMKGERYVSTELQERY